MHVEAALDNVGLVTAGYQYKRDGSKMGAYWQNGLLEVGWGEWGSL